MNVRRAFVSAFLVMVTLTVAVLTGCKGKLGDELIEASYQGDLKKMEDLIDCGASVDGRGYDGWTPLSVAAREGRLDAVRLLTTKGADVNAEEGGGNTPLFWAAYYGHLDVVEYLLANGADKARRCSDCMSVIEVAKSRGHEQIVSVLERSSSR